MDKHQAGDMQPGRLCGKSILLENACMTLQVSTICLHQEGQDLCFFAPGLRHDVRKTHLNLQKLDQATASGYATCFAYHGPLLCHVEAKEGPVQQ